MHGLLFEKSFFETKWKSAKRDLSALKKACTGLYIVKGPAPRAQNLLQKLLLAIFHARAERDLFGGLLAQVEMRLQHMKNQTHEAVLIVGSAPRLPALPPALAAQP